MNTEYRIQTHTRSLLIKQINYHSMDLIMKKKYKPHMKHMKQKAEVPTH